MSIQIISATNRPGNLSIVLAGTYQRQLEAAGVDADLMNLEELPLDILATDMYGKRSELFLEFQNRIYDNKHFLFIVPEYNGSIPGILKIFIDACDYPATFHGKYAWLVGLGAGAGGNVKGLAHLKDILEFLGTEVDPSQVTISKIREKMDRQGTILQKELEDTVAAQTRHIAKALKASI